MRRLAFQSVAGLGLLLVSGVLLAEETPAETDAEMPSWSNETDLSLVLTAGNSQTETFGFSNDFLRNWKRGVLRLQLSGTRSNTSDDPFELIDPGFTFPPGGVPENPTSTLVRPGPEPDVEQYFAELRNDRRISGTLTWNVGSSWDRNLDAGIRSRTIVFGGLGNVWFEKDQTSLNTSYGLSWTSRDETEPDPEKDDRFGGLRLTSDYVRTWGNTTYRNEVTANGSLKDIRDYSFDMTNSLSVAMNKLLSLRVSLRWLYNNEPALEDVDLIAQVQLRDPDGIPGSGDEFFETVASGGTKIEVSEVRVRKRQLDTVFNVSLVLRF